MPELEIPLSNTLGSGAVVELFWLSLSFKHVHLFDDLTTISLIFMKDTASVV